MVRSRKTKTIVENLLKELIFQQGEKINNDPFHVISEKRKKNNISTYEHQLNLDLEKATNLYTWKQVKQVLINTRQHMELEKVTSFIIV